MKRLFSLVSVFSLFAFLEAAEQKESTLAFRDLPEKIYINAQGESFFISKENLGNEQAYLNFLSSDLIYNALRKGLGLSQESAIVVPANQIESEAFVKFCYYLTTLHPMQAYTLAFMNMNGFEIMRRLVVSDTFIKNFKAMIGEKNAVVLGEPDLQKRKRLSEHFVSKKEQKIPSLKIHYGTMRPIIELEGDFVAALLRIKPSLLHDLQESLPGEDLEITLSQNIASISSSILISTLAMVEQLYKNTIRPNSNEIDNALLMRLPTTRTKEYIDKMLKVIDYFGFELVSKRLLILYQRICVLEQLNVLSTATTKLHVIQSLFNTNTLLITGNSDQYCVLRNQLKELEQVCQFLHLDNVLKLIQQFDAIIVSLIALKRENAEFQRVHHTSAPYYDQAIRYTLGKQISSLGDDIEPIIDPMSGVTYSGTKQVNNFLRQLFKNDMYIESGLTPFSVYPF